MGICSYTYIFILVLLVTRTKIISNPCCINSTRKRQSVVCRYADGRLVLYCKVIVSCKFSHKIDIAILQLVKKMTLGQKYAFHRVLIL